MNETKRCSRCGQEYPATKDWFGRDKRARGGLKSRCRGCERELSRLYREANPDKRRESARRYSADHREKEAEYSRRYRSENSERKRESARRYRENHPDTVRAWVNRRRALKHTAPGTHTSADIQLQARAQTDKQGILRCWWCSSAISGQDYHEDHRVPLVKGGSNAAENIVLACPRCNLLKHDKLHFNGRLL